MQEAQHQAKLPFMSVEREQTDKKAVENKNARLTFEALTQLRGTALKAAQRLSMEMHLLPERYRKELEESFHQVLSLNRVLVCKALQAEFGKPLERLFANFNDKSLCRREFKAVASRYLAW